MAVAPLARSAEIVDLRLADLTALDALFRMEEQEWAGRLRWDFRPSAEMLMRNIEAGVLPGYAAVHNGDVIGYCYFIQEGPKGLLGGLYVLPEAETAAGEIGELLALHALETLSNMPQLNRIEGQLIHFDDARLRPTFERHGFEVFPRLFLYLDLANTPSFDGNDQEQAKDWKLAPWKNDFGRLARLISDCYAGHVDSRLNDQYATTEGARRFLQNIVTLPGCGNFLPQSSLRAIHPLTRGWLGVVMTSEVMKGVAHITQICVSPDYRAKGMGKALLIDCLERLRAAGFHGVSLTVTESNRQAVQLYRELGFDTVQGFDAYALDW